MADWPGHPVTLFRALKKANGQVVVVDAEVIAQTTMVARNSDEFYKAIGQGWVEGSPQAALDRFEAEEQTIGQLAAERAASDLKMSESAQQEAADYEKTVPLQHVPVIPEAVKKPRGRPKKIG
jgi:hypothetical protein